MLILVEKRTGLRKWNTVGYFDNQTVVDDFKRRIPESDLRLTTVEVSSAQSYDQFRLEEFIRSSENPEELRILLQNTTSTATPPVLPVSSDTASQIDLEW